MGWRDAKSGCLGSGRSAPLVANNLGQRAAGAGAHTSRRPRALGGRWPADYPVGRQTLNGGERKNVLIAVLHSIFRMGYQVHSLRGSHGARGRAEAAGY